MESLRASSEALMAAPSLALFASCLSESIRCSDPAKSTSVSDPTSPGLAPARCTLRRNMACDRLDASPSAPSTRTSTSGTGCTSPDASVKSWHVAPPLSRSRTPLEPTSTYEAETTSLPEASSVEKRSAATRDCNAVIVNVFPDPVWPYISTVPGTVVEAACRTSGATSAS
eukprot:scaffold26096_cov31-Tisochrysis_lutea.AAC.2